MAMETVRHPRVSAVAQAAAVLGLATCQVHDAGAPGAATTATILLTTTAVIVDPLQTLTVTATPRDSAGNVLTGRTVTWTSSRPSIASVDTNGRVTALASGMTTVTATIDGKSASVTINVAFPAPPPVPPPPPPPPQPPASTVDSVASLGLWTFPDAMHGWVVSDRGDILATADGGVTWTQQGSGLGPLRSVDFADSTRGLVGSVSGSLYRTTDGGRTWTDIAFALPKAPVGLCGITHFGSRVYVVGRYTGATDLYTSPDVGATWQYTSLAGMMSGLVDVAFLDQSTGLIGGSGIASTGQGPATILKTTDGGLTWRVVFTSAAGPGWAWKIFPVTASIIYVAIESLDGTYRVVKSEDGGESWTIQIVATGQPLGGAGGLQGIGFLDINVGWVGGFFTGMYATTNGGLTWSKVGVTSALVNRFRRVGNTLFTAGTKGVLRYDPRP